MARPKLELTDEERKARLNKQKYDSLCKYLKTDEGKEYRKRMTQNRKKKIDDLKQTVIKLQSMVNELQNQSTAIKC